MNRLSLRRLSVLAIVSVLGVSPLVHAQSHSGVEIERSGNDSVTTGVTFETLTTITHNDSYGDTLVITEVWTVVDPIGHTTRVPESGNLPVLQLTGNARFAGAFGELPVILGAPMSTHGGLAGIPAPGRVVLIQDSYVVQSDDPFAFLENAHVIHADACDNPDSEGCSGESIELIAPWWVNLEASFCQGDSNADGMVDVDDLINVLLDWGGDGAAHGGDITGSTPGSLPDGIVDVNDISHVLLSWGACP